MIISYSKVYIIKSIFIAKMIRDRIVFPILKKNLHILCYKTNYTYYQIDKSRNYIYLHI